MAQGLVWAYTSGLRGQGVVTFLVELDDSTGRVLSKKDHGLAQLENRETLRSTLNLNPRSDKATVAALYVA